MATLMERFSLEGKVALVTGGAGLYGRQIVRGLAEMGAKVFAASRSLEPLEEVAGELRREGLDVTALSYDQGSTESILALRDQIMERAGRVDCLVNNAVGRGAGGVHITREQWQECMNIDAAGLMEITRAFGEVMAGQGGGSIINIGSIYGIVGYDAWLYEGMSFDGLSPSYYYNKGGMANVTRFWAGYYGKFGVRVNCVHPGGLSSDRNDPAFREKYGKKTFLGRMAGRDDLAGCIAFLASDASSYITGTNIPVDGGLSAK